MNYSLDKIARELGVSKSTVSLVLNGHASENRISAELERTIKDYCRKVNYVPNIHAKRAGSKYVKNIGLLINENLLCDGSNPFSDQNAAEITGGVVSAAAKKGFRVTIQFYNQTTAESDIFNWLRDREIDGLIYYGYSFDARWHKCFMDEKRCVVGIGIQPCEGIATVNVDNVGAMYELGKLLLKKGRRRFFYLSGNQTGYVSGQRLEGLRKALEEEGISLSPERIVCADFSEEIAYCKISEQIPDADAIVCANDDMAIGVIRALTEKGISVPDEVSVTGADNIKISRYFSPAITTIDNCNALLGKYAFEELLHLIKGGKARNKIVESRVVSRASC
ncbi:MAG: LacI family transcriptional regulator [Ruminococcaceae bacterium]|nr:LacI family transcriptional regulator [Oscillospiraceae bacterium]